MNDGSGARKRPGSKAPKPKEEKFRAGALSEAFFADPDERRKHGIPTSNDKRTDVVVELNLFHEQGLSGSRERLERLYAQVAGKSARRPLKIADTYMRCYLSINQTMRLIELDQEGEVSKGKGSRVQAKKIVPPEQRAIYRIWPDFAMNPLVDRSVATIKGDAARRSYDATGTEIVWAVIDSGIDARHPHFGTHDTLGGSVEKLHRDFTRDPPEKEEPLVDESGHGTHVAGIIGGAAPALSKEDLERRLRVGQRIAVSDESKTEKIQPRKITDPTRLSGVAPRCKLISLKVLGAGGRCRSTDVIRALEYVRVELNGHGKPPLRVHGVNISLGYDFNAKWFACGQSPVCIEVDRLVRTGVVVVIAAGNTGYGELLAATGRTNTSLALTINDPANAALAITVGATHRDSPHTYGVSYFSSKGPTGDGRAKPDLVAPGERITSCASGKHLQELQRGFPGDPVWQSDQAVGYIDQSGTSMAAPHVSGAIAAFLSIRQEFIGRPDEVKRIFLESATSLGREKYFEGRGLVDLMRAIQSV